MPIKKAKFLREENKIFPLDENGKRADKPEVFKTNNLAKKASRKIQMDEDGALGRGTLIKA